MNPKHEFEVYTSTDKAKRDELFQALRNSNDPFERQVVKFSSVEPIMRSDGKQMFDTTQYYPTTGKDRFLKFNPKIQIRPMFRSTWSVAHPKSENGEYYSREEA